MSHFHLQSLWRTQSLWNAVGDESSVTSIQPPKPRRNIMKKLTHIAAPVALTALLSACAVPGPEQMMQEASLYLDLQQALENPGPGGLQPATVQQALDENPAPGTNLYLDVQQALENPGPGGLQQAVQQALDENPAPGNLSEAVQHLTQGASQEAVNAAVQQALAQQEQASQTTGKPLYQELEFRFRNLGKGTEKFVKKLHTIFKRYEGGKDRTLIPPAPGETDDIVFVLRDPWGIDPDIKDDIQDDIRYEAESADIELPDEPSPQKGLPFAWQPKAEPIDFRTETLTYHSAGAQSKSAGTERGESSSHCNVKFTIGITGTVRGKLSVGFVYDTQTKGVTRLGASNRLRKDLKGEPVVTADGKVGCKIKDPGQYAWYIMAHTRESPVAAEYHEARVSLVDPRSYLYEAKREGFPGKVTRGIPACPPQQWGHGATELEKVLPLPREGERKCERLL